MIPQVPGYRVNVGLMIVNLRGEVLMGERHDLPGAWQMPQGGIDAGETPQQAALRELGEETGMAAQRVQIVAEHPLWLAYVVPPSLRPAKWATEAGQIQKWFLLRYDGNDLPTPPQDTELEFKAFRWVPITEVPTQIIYFRQAIYEEVAAYFSKKL